MRNLIVLGKVIPCVRIESGESMPEINAASELKKYLGIVGIDVTDGAEFTFAISEDGTAGYDGYAIDVNESGIAIRGGNGRGVLYGVYSFLEKYAGMRFFTPKLETYGKGDVVVDGGCAYVPTFEFRQSDWRCIHEKYWAVKNKVNHLNIPLPDELGSYSRYALYAHTMGRLCGAPHHLQPCLSDPEVLKMAKENVRDILKNDPTCTLISVSQNDNQNYCTCEKCAAVDEEEGSHMGTLLRFVNAIADDIKDDYPHIVIDTLAYQYTRKPPKITKPRPNVCIRLCSIECCFCHSLSDDTCEKNAAFYKDIVGWNEICERIYVWDYVTNFGHYIQSFPNLSVLRDNMRFYASHHVKGMYPEGPHNATLSGEFGELKAYLLAKLMWEPFMSAEEYNTHIDEFMKAYYGEGWAYIRAYADTVEALTKGHHMGIYAGSLTYIDAEKLEALEETLDSWWDKAEELAGDKLENVKRSRFQWRCVKLDLHPDAEKGREFYNECLEKGIKWNEFITVSPENIDFSTPPSTWADSTMYRIGD